MVSNRKKLQYMIPNMNIVSKHEGMLKNNENKLNPDPVINPKVKHYKTSKIKDWKNDKGCQSNPTV